VKALPNAATNVDRADSSIAQVSRQITCRRSAQKSRFQDFRVAKSYHALRSEFLDLLKSSTLENIAITGIADKAGVTVPVFYRQFAWKEALLEDIAGEETRLLLDHIRSAIGSADNAHELQALCALVNGKRDLWKLLLTKGAATSMRNEFTRSIIAMNLDAKTFCAGMPPALAATFVAHGVFDVLGGWLDQGPNSPVATIARVLQDPVLGPAVHRD